MVGRQLTITSSSIPPLLQEMLGVATRTIDRVGLIARGTSDGIHRGWSFEPETQLFLSDRNSEYIELESLLTVATQLNPLTFTNDRPGALCPRPENPFQLFRRSLRLLERSHWEVLPGRV